MSSTGTKLKGVFIMNTLKLNLGCGRDIKEGWVNIDAHPINDNVQFADLDVVNSLWQFKDECTEEFLLSHTIEHLRYPLALFESIYRIAKPGALLTIKCPYGSSDDADEDPTHVRRMFLGSFSYFAKPTHYLADYKYEADWQCEKISLLVNKDFVEKFPGDALLRLITHQRNIVIEMIAELRAIKPMREAKKELIKHPEIVIQPAVINA